MAVKRTSQALRQRKQVEQLRALIAQLPAFCQSFFIGIEPTTTILTRISYAYDLGVFFDYLLDTQPSLIGKDRFAITIDDIAHINAQLIERYLEHLNLYERNDQFYENTENGKKRKLASLRTFFDYFFQHQLIPANTAALVKIPKIREKSIIRLEPDEVANLLDLAESGEGLSSTAKRYHKLTRTRDVAILTLLLGTGMRISECVGLDRADVDFNLGGLRIMRKGGKEQIIYFWDEVADALRSYLAQRNQIQNDSGEKDADALFLSIQKKRITARAVQNLVKKYSEIAVPLKHISPHKLRSTYGTALYRETGDIYLVADVLGHSDVNTTRKHYASVADDQRRRAARAVKLRDDEMTIKTDEEDE